MICYCVFTVWVCACLYLVVWVYYWSAVCCRDNLHNTVSSGKCTALTHTHTHTHTHCRLHKHSLARDKCTHTRSREKKYAWLVQSQIFEKRKRFENTRRKTNLFNISIISPNENRESKWRLNALASLIVLKSFRKDLISFWFHLRNDKKRNGHMRSSKLWATTLFFWLPKTLAAHKHTPLQYRHLHTFLLNKHILYAVLFLNTSIIIVVMDTVIERRATHTLSCT